MSTFSLCSSTSSNTGGIDCERKRGTPSKLLPGSLELEPDDWASSQAFLDAMLAAINSGNGVANKVFPLPTIQGNTDNTEQNTTGNLGYGLKVFLREGRQVYQFQVLAGQSQFKAMRKFNNVIMPMLVLDDANCTWGYLNAAGNFVGCDAQIFVSGNGFEDGNSAEKKVVTIEVTFLSNAQFHDAAYYFEGDTTIFTEASFVGLKDAFIGLSGAVSGTTKFTVRIPTAKLGKYLDLADYYPTELADTDMWLAFTGAAFGTSLAITGATYNSSDKTWSIVFSNTPYTALGSGAKIKVKLADPSVLFAQGATGIEGVELIITKP